MNFNCPPIIVDTSFIVYFSAFGLLKYFIKNNDFEKGEPLPKDLYPEYKLALEKQIIWKIKNALKRHVSFIDESKFIFAIDCPKRNIWRNEYYPGYKIRRYTKQEEPELDWNEIYSHVYNIFLPNYCEQHNCITVGANTSEGDDVIAILTKELYDKTNKKIIVLASDTDLLQLNNYAKFINLYGEEYSLDTYGEKHKLGKLTPEKFLLLKALMGDSADDCPSVFERCGRKTALKLINNPNELKIKLNENKEYIINLKRNKMLMDFNAIPEIVKEEILTNYKTKRNSIENL